nr:hypothetical protein [Burkholderia pseudomallei]
MHSTRRRTTDDRRARDAQAMSRRAAHLACALPVAARGAVISSSSTPPIILVDENVYIALRTPMTPPSKDAAALARPAAAAGPRK